MEPLPFAALDADVVVVVVVGGDDVVGGGLMGRKERLGHQNRLSSTSTQYRRLLRRMAVPIRCRLLIPSSRIRTVVPWARGWRTALDLRWTLVGEVPPEAVLKTAMTEEVRLPDLLPLLVDGRCGSPSLEDARLCSLSSLPEVSDC